MSNKGRTLTCWCSKPNCRRCAAADLKYAPDELLARLNEGRPRLRITRTEVLSSRGPHYMESIYNQDPRS